MSKSQFTPDPPPVVPTVALAIDTYSQYIADWAVRKKFRRRCAACGGSGVALGSSPDHGNPPCEFCDGRGVVGQTFGEQVALIHSELSELLEAHRSGHGDEPDEHCPEFSKMAIEAADAVIRIMDLAASYRWQLGAAIEAKMAVNETRPDKHGKRY